MLAERASEISLSQDPQRGQAFDEDPTGAHTGTPSSAAVSNGSHTVYLASVTLCGVTCAKPRLVCLMYAFDSQPLTPVYGNEAHSLMQLRLNVR